MALRAARCRAAMPCSAVQYYGQKARQVRSSQGGQSLARSVYAFSRSRSRALARVARADISMRVLEDSAVLGLAAAWALRERERWGQRGEASRQKQDGHKVQWSDRCRVKGIEAEIETAVHARNRGSGRIGCGL